MRPAQWPPLSGSGVPSLVRLGGTHGACKVCEDCRGHARGMSVRSYGYCDRGVGHPWRPSQPDLEAVQQEGRARGPAGLPWRWRGVCTTWAGGWIQWRNSRVPLMCVSRYETWSLSYLRISNQLRDHKTALVSCVHILVSTSRNNDGYNIS